MEGGLRPSATWTGLSRASGEACGPAWTLAKPGRGRALAAEGFALPSPAGRVVEMWGRLTKQVRPRPSPSAPLGPVGGQSCGSGASDWQGRAGRGAESRGAAGGGGAGRSSLQPGPLRSAQPAPRKLSYAVLCDPETWRLRDPGPGLLRLHSAQRPGQHVEVMAEDHGSS